MNPLHSWTGRTAKRRGARGGAERGYTRRRALAFEQCEPRIALSATPAKPEIEMRVIDGAMLEQLWLETPETVVWSRAATFTPLDGSPGERQPIVIRFVVQSDPAFRNAFPAENASLEGGTIALGMTSTSSVTLAGATNSVWKSAFTDVLLDSRAAEPRLTRGSISASDQFHILQPSSVDSGILVGQGGDNLGLSDYPSSIKPDSIQGYVGSTDETYFDPEAETGLALNGSPVLRIPIPGGATNSEGGAIDLTAIAGSTSVLGARSPSRTSLADAGGRTTPTFAAVETASRQTLPIEGLRARAVVFEVAAARDSGERDVRSILDEAPAAGRDALNGDNAPGTKDHSSFRRAPSRRAAHGPSVETTEQSAGVDADAAVATTPSADATAGEETANRGQTAANRAETGRAAANSAAAHDAALADLGDPSDRAARDAGAAGLASTATRRQKAGLALALVVGAGPLVRRARRARMRPDVEQPAGRP